MGVATFFTAARMAAIEAASIVSGAVNGSGDLILTKFNGTTVNAGNVKGANGAPGAPGTSAPVNVITSGASSFTRTPTATPLGTYFSSGDDVEDAYASFVAPASGIVQVITAGYLRSGTAGTAANLDFEIRTGSTWGAGTLVRAAQLSSAVGNHNTVFLRAQGGGYVTGLTPGQTYYARTMLYQQNANGVFNNLHISVITH